MSNIHLDFDQARAKHLLFKSRLRSLIYGEQVDENGIISEHDCALGQWIYNKALKEYADIPEVHELKKVHSNIHVPAREILRLYKEGKTDEARQKLDEIDDIAQELVALLDVIESKVKERYEGGDNKENHIRLSHEELYELLAANEKLDKIITEQSAELRRERKLLHDFFMQAPIFLAILRGPDHIYEMTNPLYEQTIGAKDLIGKSVKDVFPEMESQGFIQMMDHIYNTGEVVTASENPITINVEGKPVEYFVNFTVQPFRNSKGEIEGLISCSYDVTEQVLARKAVETSNEKSKFITESMPQKVWKASADGTINYYNQLWMDYTGKTLDDLKNSGWLGIIHPDDFNKVGDVWSQAIDSGAEFELEFRLLKHTGEYQWHLSRGLPFKNEAGEVTMWLGTCTNVHAMKNVQEQLQHSYEDLEVKVKFRNLQLEKENKELREELAKLRK